MKQEHFFIFTPPKCLHLDFFFVRLFATSFENRRTPAQGRNRKQRGSHTSKVLSNPSHTFCAIFWIERHFFQNHGPGFRSPIYLSNHFPTHRCNIRSGDADLEMWGCRSTAVMWDVDSYLKAITVLCMALSCHSRELNKGNERVPPRYSHCTDESGCSAIHISILILILLLIIWKKWWLKSFFFFEHGEAGGRVWGDT